MTYVLLLVGFVLLIKGADFFVDGSSSVAIESTTDYYRTYSRGIWNQHAGSIG